MPSKRMSFITVWAVTVISFLSLTSFEISVHKPTRKSSNRYVTFPAECTVGNSKTGYSFSWLKTDTSIALKNNDRVVWQFNYNKNFDKPYFYPLRTVSNGHELAWFRPVDHPWHRGLWFSWKMINNVNYWEEDVQTRLSSGRSKINAVDLRLNKDYSAVIILKLTYAPEGKQKVLDEDRTIFVSAPDEKGNYYIDWDMKFKAAGLQVVLDRTPPQKFGGPFYGGYAGLSYRAAESMQEHKYIDSDGWEGTNEVVGHGQQAEWMDLTGTIGSTTGSYAGVSMFSHPSNINSPVPWYVYKDKQFAFFNAALLFDKPVKLAPSEQMHLIYRVLVHEDTVSAIGLTNEYKKFLKVYPYRTMNTKKGSSVKAK